MVKIVCCVPVVDCLLALVEGLDSHHTELELERLVLLPVRGGPPPGASERPGYPPYKLTIN